MINYILMSSFTILYIYVTVIFLHGISNCLSMVLWPTCLSLDYQWGGSKYHAVSIYHTCGDQCSIRGFNTSWVKIDPGSKYHVCQNTIWHWQRWQWMIWALMEQLSIAQYSANPTYWNISYDKGDHLAVHKSFISSLHILSSKEHDDFSCLYWIAKFHNNLNRGNNTTGAYSFWRK